MAKIANISSISFTFENCNVFAKINWTNLTNWKAQQAFEELMKRNSLDYAGSRNQEYDYLILNMTITKENVKLILSIFESERYSVNRNGNTITFS